MHPKTKQKERQKKKFLRVLAEQYGNYTATCKAMKIDPSTQRKWRAEDKEFDEQCQLIKDDVLDQVEMNAFKKAIEDGSEIMTMFILKTQGKHRGWVERQDNLQINVGEGTKMIQVLPADASIIERLHEKKVVEIEEATEVDESGKARQVENTEDEG